MSMNFQDLKMQLCDTRMKMCQIKMQHGEASRNIANLKHDLNKNEVGFDTLVVVSLLVVTQGLDLCSWIVPMF